MKKVLMLLTSFGLLAGLLGSAQASVRLESLGLGANPEAALVTDDLDLIFLFPNKAADYGSVVDLRYEGLTATDDRWGGVLDNKYENIGTLGIYTHRPQRLFTQDPGHPTLGGVSNDWNDIVNNWSEINGNQTFAGNGTGAWGSIYGWEIPTPQNDVDLFWAKKTETGSFGIQVTYGKTQGQNNWNLTKATPTDGGNDDIVGGTFLGFERFSDSASVFGAAVGYGKDDVGGWGLNVRGSFHIGNIDLADVEKNRNATDTADITRFNATLEDDGINQIQGAVLLTKQNNETSETRVAALVTLGKLATKELYQWDSNADGDYADGGDDDDTRNTEYKNTDLRLNVAKNYVVNDGRGKVVAAVGLAYRTQEFTDEVMQFDSGDARREETYYNNSNFKSFQVPFNVGAEQQLFSWLTARVGASTNLFASFTSENTSRDGDGSNNVTLPETEVYETSDAFTNVTFTTGLGATWNNFTLDVLLDQTYFENTVINNLQIGRGIFYAGDQLLIAKAEAKYKF